VCADGVLQCIAVYCSVLQCASLCCSVLQWDSKIDALKQTAISTAHELRARACVGCDKVMCILLVGIVGVLQCVAVCVLQ